MPRIRRRGFQRRPEKPLSEMTLAELEAEMNRVIQIAPDTEDGRWDRFSQIDDIDREINLRQSSMDLRNEQQAKVHSIEDAKCRG